jgi:hypothetical protein
MCKKSRIPQREPDDAPVGEVDLHGAGGAVLLQAGVRHAVDKELVRPRVEAVDGVIPVVGMQLHRAAQTHAKSAIVSADWNISKRARFCEVFRSGI